MNTVQQYRIPLLIGAGTLVVAILLYALLISPQSAKLSSLNDQATLLQSQAGQLQSKLTLLESEKQKLPANCADLAKIATQIPSVQTPTDIDAEESSFEAQLNTLLGQTGTTFSAFSGFAPATAASAPAAAAAAGGPATSVVPIPVTMTVTGNYGQMSAFVAGLDKFPRLFVIQSFTLSFGSSSGGGSSPTPLWVGGRPTAAGVGPYSLAIAGSIYYTKAPSAMSACAKATATAATAAAPPTANATATAARQP